MTVAMAGVTGSAQLIAGEYNCGDSAGYELTDAPRFEDADEAYDHRLGLVGAGYNCGRAPCPIGGPPRPKPARGVC